MSEDLDHKDLDTFAILQEVVTIVSAYFSHNAMPAADLPAFITAVHASVVRLASPAAPAEERAPENPAVAVKRSVTKDYIVCLEDGKKFKSLRRHLSSFHNLTPDEYRAKWQLPSDYPMVAPAYSAVRSRLARDSGLGQMVAKDDALEDGEDGVSENAAAEGDVAGEQRQAVGSGRGGKAARGKMSDGAGVSAVDDAPAGAVTAGADTAERQAGSDATASAKRDGGKSEAAALETGDAEPPPKKPGRGRPRKQA